jgi:hypothetical protein
MGPRFLPNPDGAAAEGKNEKVLASPGVVGVYELAPLPS